MAAPPPDDATDFAYEWLSNEVKTEEDRTKMIDGKLQSIVPIASTVITLLLALITFLTSGKVAQFTRTSILIVTFGGAYVAIQFLWAFLRAIKGLARRDFLRVKPKDIIPNTNETKETMRRRAFEEMLEILQYNKESNNNKVTQLACGHEAIKNAIVGLIAIIFTLLFITLFGNQS